MANQCSGCGAPLEFPFRTCSGCAVEFFQRVYTPQNVQKSDSEIVQKVKKESPKPTRKTRTNRGYRLSANVREADRKIILAKRAWAYLQDAGGQSSLHALYRAMHGHRYKALWNSAVHLLLTTRAADITGRQITLISGASPFYGWRLVRRRKHRPRSRGKSTWFRANILGV